MTPDQVRYCAEDIVNSDNQLIYNLTLDEVNLCMEKGVKGEYGEIYNRMDQAIVFKWLQSYIDEKLIVGEKLRGQQDGDNRQNIHEIFQTETMSTILHDVVSKLAIKEVKEPEKPRVVSAEQKLVNEWMTRFDKIHEKIGTITNGIRTIPNHEEKQITLDEFLQVQLEIYKMDQSNPINP
jgi:hypothetical protein